MTTLIAPSSAALEADRGDESARHNKRRHDERFTSGRSVPAVDAVED